MTAEPGLVVETLAPGIRQIRLARPERLNALGVDMVHALRAAVEAERSARVLLVRGSGRGFCAGADLKERQGMDEAARLAHNRAINAAFDALAAAPMPTIAVINGLALGGGCELALCCDLRFAADSASIGLTEARIGAIPGAGGTQRLPRLIGTARALEMMFSGEPVTAARAAAIGLVQAAVPDDALDAHVLRFATLLASRSPRTARSLKRVVHAGLATTLEAGLALERAALSEIFSAPDYAEGLAAFAAKRPPVFTD
jgi:enoyl-CoA hydratase/carnithine racemase